MKAEIRALIVFAIVLSVAFVPMISDDSDASAYQKCEGLNISTFDDNIKLKAGGSYDINLTLSNDSDGDITVKIGFTTQSERRIMAELSATDFTLAKGKSTIVKATIYADRNVEHGTYISDFNFTVYNFSTAKDGSAVLTVSAEVTTAYQSGAYFNKILGVFENNLPEPFNGPMTSALLTLLIWAIIASLAFAVLYFLAGRYFKNDDSERSSVRKKSGIMIILIIMLYGVIETLKVYGADEAIIRVFSDITAITNIIMIAYIVWNVYSAVVKHIFHNIEKQNRIEGADTSLIPLFLTIGEIVIGVVALAAVLGTLGVDLAAIIASAGIFALAISIGAQGVLTQFFGGLILLINRPFKTGDIVKINGSTDFYEVKKVGILCTTFRNWDNMEIITMPNNTVGSDHIVNVTNDSQVYRLFLYYSVDFESDFDLVRRVLTETASRHQMVITDGSVSPPDVRVNEFLSTAVEVRLAVYIRDFNKHQQVSDELYQEGIRDLVNAGVNIPYEKRDVHLILPDGEKTADEGPLKQ